MGVIGDRPAGTVAARADGSFSPSAAVANRVVWLGHATVLVEIGGARLLTDPVVGRMVGPLVRVAPRVHARDRERIDAVLLSHMHGDHVDAPSLRLVGRDVRVLAPHGAARWLRRHGLRRVAELRAGDTAIIGELTVTAVPATHDGRRYPFSARCEALGYVVRGERSVYFAGDTDLFDEMARVARGVDVALLPIAGWGPKLGPGHLDAARAAQAAARIRPRLAIPIHWGTLAPPHLARSAWARSDAAARRFADLAAAARPPVAVRVLAPGGEASLE